ncbi:DUF3305 domain-containing protein [Motiliproteus sediminis]|uniref:DUF3305 domain-containing protein n=1 Tax=Motiliproteus sediminis TaxID=1468178 RepID=UPI001AEFF3D1|nr:DUF3305 domain-containing protein [Motiliproteus sediminis]
MQQAEPYDWTETFWPLRVVLRRKTVARGLWEVDSWSAVRVESVRDEVHETQQVEPLPAQEDSQDYCWTGQGLELFLDERAAYRFNLSAEKPKLFVICTEDEEMGRVMRPYLVSASQDAAASYMDGGEEDVFAVPMPDAIQCWIEGFIARHGEPDLGLRSGKRRRYRGARKQESNHD